MSAAETASASATGTVREARARYFQDNGFPADGGDSERFVKLPVGPLRIWLPNIAPRRRAVKLHDLHHVVTGYATDWRGEFAISAFETGAGCGRYAMAWLINAGGVAGGLLLAPSSTVRAYARGRQSETLYHLVPNGPGFDAVLDHLLDLDVGTLRARLRIAPDGEAAAVTTWRDWISAVSLAAFGAAAHVGPVVVIILGLVMLLR